MNYSPEELEYLRQQQGIYPQQPMPPPSKDPELMQSLLNLKVSTVEPLKHSWRGDEEIEPGVWKKRPGFEMMNEQGINWCAGHLDRFLSSTFSMTNLDENMMNWHMRTLGKTVWNGVCMFYLEWDLRKKNIPTICHGLIQTSNAVLLMARGDGTRRFLSTTHQVSTMQNTQIQEAQKKRGWGIFKKEVPQPEGYNGN